MSTEGQYEPKPVFVTVDEDGTAQIVKEITNDMRAMVNEGTLAILRFTSFSSYGQELSGKGGRVEGLSVEEVTPEDEEEESVESVWEDSWDSL